MISTFQSLHNFKIRQLRLTRGGGFQKFSICSPPQPWLFIGLGNPGPKFQGTRHNVGFEMIDAFADSLGVLLHTIHCKALFGQGFVGDAPVFLAKPQTYMNLSGGCVGPLAAYYKLPLNRVLVIHDDMELPCGVLRLQNKGGHGSHNGLKSVMDHFRRNREFARLRIGARNIQQTTSDLCTDV